MSFLSSCSTDFLSRRDFLQSLINFNSKVTRPTKNEPTPMTIPATSPFERPLFVDIDVVDAVGAAMGGVGFTETAESSAQGL